MLSSSGFNYAKRPTMKDARPDPDVLLQQIHAQDVKTQRGKLKIFFGSSAGVGKTYDMLTAAHQAKAQGLDVLVGIVETHGRQETQALLAGLDILPLKTIHYRDQVLYEFDLDSALARKPTILLVDELAHSNAPTSRHPKRWQDVEELIQAGINVYTTLNVQHLASLNDVINQITGVAVRETLPDWFFDQADAIVLVDITADELLTRLQEGKVYLPSQAQKAVKHFFRKGNLIALRELALRRTADRVDADMRDYRKQAAITPIWNTADQLLVGVGNSSNNERLIRHAARLATSLHTQWYVVYVETPNRQAKTVNQQWVLDALRLAEELGAKTDVISASSIAEGLTTYAHQFNIGHVVLGQHQIKFAGIRPSIAELISQQDTKLDLILVNQTHERNKKIQGNNNSSISLQKKPFIDRLASQAINSKHNQVGYLVAIIGCTIVTVIGLSLLTWFDSANVLMLYLLMIVFVSVRFGRIPGVIATLISVSCFDYFFVQPTMSFSVSDVQYLVTFAVMLIVSLLINNLAVGLRFQAFVARRREQQAIIISHLAQQLSVARKNEHIVTEAQRWLRNHIANDVVILMPSTLPEPLSEQALLSDSIKSTGRRGQLQTLVDSNIPPEFDWAIAQWVFDHNQNAGFGTHTLVANAMHYRPLSVSGQVFGIVALMPNMPNSFHLPENQRLLDMAVSQIALALERIHLAKTAQLAVIKAEGERLRGTLLSALSHDIRTPVTVLSALASNLMQHYNSQTPDAITKNLVQDIQQQAQNIQQLVVNILDYASLQSGGLTLKPQWISLEELIGGIIYPMEELFKTHPLTINIDPQVQFIFTDELILARVLTNLLTNAINYTPIETPIFIEATLEPVANNTIQNQHSLTIRVTDQGSGIKAGMETKIFERFTRGDNESTTTGLGLGLALSRELVQNLGGTLTAQNIAPHGAQFTIRLPWTAAQPDLTGLLAEPMLATQPDF